MAGTVTVACKIPTGLMLRTFVDETYTERVMGGGVKEVKRSRPTAWSHKIHGPARKLGQDPLHQIVEGAGLTHGVDADEFAKWLEQNKDSDVVKKGLVFSAVKTADVVAAARERRNEKTGMEQLDPKNLPAEFKRVIETAPQSAQPVPTV